MLNLMYITNRPEIAQIAEENGVDWIFVDMEFIGKDNRQGGLDTVQNHHTIEDVRRVKASLKEAKVLVRVNPIHKALIDAEGKVMYMDSKSEIESAIEAGADIVMLPFFHTVDEVKQFTEMVKSGNERRVQRGSMGSNGSMGSSESREPAKVCLLLETPEAAILLDEILNVPGIDMIHIGLNDLHLAMGMKFMFQLLTDGIVEQLAKKIKAKGIPFGFGGIASLHGGALPGSYVLKEHYRLGSSMVIVGRSFCNTNVVTDLDEVREIFRKGIAEIRHLEGEAQAALDYFDKSHSEVVTIVNKIVEYKN